MVRLSLYLLKALVHF